MFNPFKLATSALAIFMRGLEYDRMVTEKEINAKPTDEWDRLEMTIAKCRSESGWFMHVEQSCPREPIQSRVGGPTTWGPGLATVTITLEKMMPALDGMKT